MRAIALIAFALTLPACAIGDVSRDGPVPEPSAVRRADTGMPTEAVYCSDLGGTLIVVGDGFSPMPRDVLTGDARLELPRVALVAASGAAQELGGVAFDLVTRELSVPIPVTLTPGVYDVRVTNPNGHSGTLAGAVRVVPPPQLDAIDPTSAANAADAPVVLTGSAFRATDTGVPPAVSLQPVAGGDAAALGGVVLQSATQVDAVVPAGLAAGFYDVTLQNPEGCSSTLPAAFEVTEPAPIDLCSSVDPSFGWVSTRTRIEICAHNSAGHGLQSTPEAFIIIGGEEIPLRREAYLDPGTVSTDSLMAALVPSGSDDARIVVGGPYDVKVVNPDGSLGVISAAFTVLADPPPQILAVNPGRGDKSTVVSLSIEGKDFKAGNLVGGSTPILSVSLVASDGVTTFPCSVTAVTLDSPSAGLDTATCTMTLPGATGGYVVRVRHEDDHSFDLFSTFAVTESSRKLAQATTPQTDLNARRRHHGAVLGTDDVGGRFIYAVGGENQAGAALASAEVASLGTFGQLGPWTTLANALPAPRTGVAVASWGRFVYVVGGSPDGASPYDPASGTTALQGPTVLRARVLGGDTAPVMVSATAGGGGTLAAGAYYYRVAAVMAATGDNPSGETLPSDEESVRVSEAGSVTVAWALPEGVASAAQLSAYRVYRSPTANLTSGTEVLLAEVAASQLSYLDNGSATPNLTQAPLTPGSLGRWVTMASLATPRFDAAATVVSVDATHAYLYVSGGRDGPGNAPADVLGSVEWIPIDTSTGGLVGSWQSGGNLTARAEHVLVPVSHALAETVPTGNFALAVAGGTNRSRLTAGGALSSLEVSVVDANTANATVGAPGAWSAVGTTSNRVGLTGIVVNDFFYAFNGWSGSGGSFASDSEKSGSTTCTGGPPCTPAFTGFSSATVSFDDGTGANTAAYRSALVFSGAYFFFVGGSTGLNASTTQNAVIRGSY